MTEFSGQKCSEKVLDLAESPTPVYQHNVSYNDMIVIRDIMMVNRRRSHVWCSKIMSSQPILIIFDL